MKFRFCGGLDAPDWILAEVAVLSKMSSIRIKLICRQVITHLLGRPFDYDKCHRLTTSERIKLDADEKKALLAALRFMLGNAAKFDVDGTQELPLEFAQLGLPADVCASMCKEYTKCKAAMRDHFERTALQLPHVLSTEWRVDFLISSSSIRELAAPQVRLNMSLSKAPASVVVSDGNGASSTSAASTSRALAFELSADKFRALHADLKAARAIMASLE